MPPTTGNLLPHGEDLVIWYEVKVEIGDDVCIRRKWNLTRAWEGSLGEGGYFKS